MTKIALFGTSADPPTAGHQTILRWLSAHYDRVLVWASDNPFKQHQTPLKHRTEMLKLVIEEIDSTSNNISLDEKLSDRRSLITVNTAKQIWGEETDFTLVIGSDLVEQMPKWYRVETLLKQVKVLIVPRAGYAINQKDLDTLNQLGGECAIAELEVGQISSSAYRLEGDKQVLTPAVRNYIARQDLYQ